MKVEVFKGDISELRDICERWKQMANSSGFEDLEPDWSHVSFRLKRLVSNECMDLLILRSDKGRPLGFMGVIGYPSATCGTVLAQEHLFYVLPEHRSFGAKALIRAAEQWAKGHECRGLLLTASKLANPRHDRVERLYERLGFELFETTFIKEFKNGM